MSKKQMPKLAVKRINFLTLINLHQNALKLKSGSLELFKFRFLDFRDSVIYRILSVKYLFYLDKLHIIANQILISKQK